MAVGRFLSSHDRLMLRVGSERVCFVVLARELDVEVAHREMDEGPGVTRSTRLAERGAGRLVAAP